MLSTDVLVLIAELAIAIAGFSSVVVALDNRAVRNWDPFQRHNLRVLLQVSALTIFFALFPLILQRAFNGESFWNWALGVYAVVHLVDVTSFLGRLPKDMPRANRLFPYVGLVVAIAKLVVAPLGTPLVAEMFYLASLVMHLAISAMGFGFLIFGKSDERSS